jgi:hypothetical protein
MRVQKKPVQKQAKQLSAEARRYQRLMGSLGVGKSIQSADEILKKSKFDEIWESEFAYKSGNSSEDLSWTLDQDQLELDMKKLNLSNEQILQALQPMLPRLQDCFSEALIRDSSLSGSARLWIHIDLAGKVESLEIEGLTGKERSRSYLKSCFEEASRKIKLPKPNQAFSITRSLYLQRL